MIQTFADWLVYGLFGLDAATPWGTALNFFVYDSLKILLLLFLISSLMGIVNAYFPIERLRTYLATHRLRGLQYLLASCFGAVTPFCSCSSIPLFIGFVKGGIPLGVTLSFLITSPLVNEVAVAMFLGSFGLRATLVYVGSGILLGCLGGILLGRMRLEPWLSPWVKQMQVRSQQQSAEWDEAHEPFLRRLPAILGEAWGTVRGVLPYVLAGIGIGALMHGFVPEAFFVRGQGHPPRHGHRLHDGRGGPVAPRSHAPEESDDVAPHRRVLRHRSGFHHPLGLSVQPRALKARGTFGNAFRAETARLKGHRRLAMLFSLCIHNHSAAKSAFLCAKAADCFFKSAD